MEYLLEPMRRAAELSCSHFLITNRGVHLVLPSFDDDANCLGQIAILLPSENKLVNQHAARICADWWNTDGVLRVHVLSSEEYIERCRLYNSRFG